MWNVESSVIAALHGLGCKVICYMDAGAYEDYRPDSSLFPAAVIGASSGWAGENWLDVRPAAWTSFAWIIWSRLNLACAIGCDGVEPDQNNGWENDPGFQISREDSIAWNREVVRQAHARGLTVLLKNSISETDELLSTGQRTRTDVAEEEPRARCLARRLLVSATRGNDDAIKDMYPVQQWQTGQCWRQAEKKIRISLDLQ